jgi:hypothetical protein
MQLNQLEVAHESIGGNKAASLQIHRRMGTSSSSMDVTCLKPSEYRGDPNTAKQQEVKPRKTAQVAATPAGGRKGKGTKGGKPSADLAPTRKLEAHLAATESLTEVLFVEAWGEIGDQLAQKCTVGDVVAIQGRSFVATCG